MTCFCLFTLQCILIVFVLHNVTSQQNNLDMSKWSGWGRWSTCSRTCGRGISFIERQCLNSTGGPGKCQGDTRKYSTCNIQDCPEGSEDFRQLQCSQFNSKSYKEKYFKWVAFNHGPFECDLRCMPKGQRFYVIFKKKVTDGTKCREGSLDVCVDGKCQVLGCDLALGSQAKFDKCQVCNGDNSKCKKMAGTFAKSNVYDYLEMAVIPTGSTSILIKDLQNSGNYIALKNFRGTYILNGDWTISQPGSFKVNGHYAKYVRAKTENYVSIAGPIDATITVQILAANPSFNFSYEFYAPKGSLNGNNMVDTYKWTITKRGECSTICAGGILKRKVKCISSRDNVAVSDFMCISVQRPSYAEACNTQPCPPSWFSGEWSHCSRSCGEGVKVRRIHCIRKVVDGQIEMLLDNTCAGEKPKGNEACMSKKSCPEWKIDHWTECSKTCGPGYRKTRVYCLEVDGSKSTYVSKSRCDATIKPLQREVCNLGSCNLTWNIGEWNKCSAHCGKGMRNRQVTCQNTKGKVFPDGYCNKLLDPVRTEECDVPGPCRPMWYATQWTKCSRKCGFGIQMRILYCATREGNNLRILGGESCKKEEQPIKMKSCHQLEPCFSQYFAGEWKQCSKQCGSGIRSRRVRCYADSRIDYSEKSCSHLEKPKFIETCNTQPCGSSIQKAQTTKSIPRSIPEILTQKAAISNTVGIATSPVPVVQSTAKSPTEAPKKHATQSTKEASTQSPNEPSTQSLKEPSTQSPKEPSTQPLTRPSKHPTTRLPTTRPPTRPRTRPATRPITRPIITTQRTTRVIPAMIISVEGPATLDINENGDYHCNAWGDPEPDVYWTLKGQRISSTSGSRFALLNQGRHLVITTAQKEDTGKLQCHTENSGGRDVKDINLVVTVKPVVTLSVLTANVEEGVPFKLICNVIGRPKPDVRWRKDGRLFYGGDGGRVKVEERRIVFSKVIHGDSGQYECNAYNSAGSSAKFMRLTVKKGLDGDCIDNERRANCALIARMKFCNHPYYKSVCCKTCSN